MRRYYINESLSLFFLAFKNIFTAKVREHVRPRVYDPQTLFEMLLVHADTRHHIILIDFCVDEITGVNRRVEQTKENLTFLK